MIRILVAALVALVGANTATHAAVAPWYDRLNQFGAVLNGDVAQMLAPHLIDSVERLDDGSFVVRAGSCTLPVTLNVIPPPQGMLGATSYEAVPGAVTCQ
jgi:hypothetical protein